MKKRLTAFWHSRAALPKACYLAAALLWLCWGVYCRVDDIGLEAWSTVPVTELTLMDMVPAPQVENGYATLSDDPQMILEGLDGRKLRTVSYVPQFLTDNPREVCLYYINRPDEPYSRDKRLFPTVQADGRYVYTLPHGGVYAVRIDPCSPPADQSVVVAFSRGAIDLNYPSDLPGGWSYFLPGWYQLFCLLLYPALAAAVLDWLRALYRFWRARARRPS